MKLNADVGEYIDITHTDSDLDIMPYIDQANIACGGHSGDGISMARTVDLAQKYNIEIGAHPSYPDIAGFGRRSMRMPDTELIPTLHAQIGALEGVTKSLNGKLSYVKPHGALYNDMIKYSDVFEQVVKSISRYHTPLKLMMQATQNAAAHLEFAQRHKVELIFEAFADRAYLANGELMPRSQSGAVLDVDDAVKQAQRIIEKSEVVCDDGSLLKLDVHSLCVHGDSPGAIEMTEQIRQCLSQH